MDERSPYAAPASEVEVFEERKGAPWKGIVLGLLTDIGGSIVLSTLIVTVIAMIMTSHGVDQNEMRTLVLGPERSLFITAALYGTGLLFSVLGGFVCARIVKQSELKWGAVMAVLSTLIGLAMGGNHEGTALTFTLYVASIVATIAGAWLGMKRNQRQRSRA